MPIGFEFLSWVSLGVGFGYNCRMLVGVVRGDFLSSAAVMCGAYLLIFDFGERTQPTKHAFAIDVVLIAH
jgi:hypothetical protein